MASLSKEQNFRSFFQATAISIICTASMSNRSKTNPNHSGVNWSHIVWVYGQCGSSSNYRSIPQIVIILQFPRNKACLTVVQVFCSHWIWEMKSRHFWRATMIQYWCHFYNHHPRGHEKLELRWHRYFQNVQYTDQVGQFVIFSPGMNKNGENLEWLERISRRIQGSIVHHFIHVPVPIWIFSSPLKRNSHKLDSRTTG